MGKHSHLRPQIESIYRDIMGADEQLRHMAGVEYKKRRNAYYENIKSRIKPFKYMIFNYKNISQHVIDEIVDAFTKLGCECDNDPLMDGTSEYAFFVFNEAFENEKNPSNSM